MLYYFGNFLEVDEIIDEVRLDCPATLKKVEKQLLVVYESAGNERDIHVVYGHTKGLNPKLFGKFYLLTYHSIIVKNF